MKTEDWESSVAFIRLDFPADQRDVAQRLAAVFAGVVGKKIFELRPEHTLREILSWSNIDSADSLDTVEFVMVLEKLIGFEMDDDFSRKWDDKTFRDLVEYASQKVAV